MAQPNTDTAALIESLAAKAGVLSSMSNEEVLILCEELLECLTLRPSEWSHAGNWALESAKLHEVADDNNHSNAQAFASENRYMFGDAVRLFISTCKDALSVKLDKTKASPGLLSTNTRSFKETDGVLKELRVYGPSPIAIPGNSFELWTNPGVGFHKKPHSNNGPVALVLGAGNQAFLTVNDALSCLLLERKPVIIKGHPLRDHFLTPYSTMLKPLIKRGLLAIVKDEGIPKTTEMLSNPLIGRVHITGSQVTDEAVRSTLSKNRPELTKSQVDEMVTSELGCVTPAIMFPHTYTSKELLNAARMIVFSKKLCGGCNCLNANAVILPKQWKQKDEFRKILLDELKRQPDFPAYYPGSRDRREEIKQHYESIEGGQNIEKHRVVAVEGDSFKGVTKRAEDCVLVVECGTFGADGYDGYALQREAFGPVLSVVEIEGSEEDQNDYVPSVLAPFINNKKNIYGSLSCMLFAPKTVDEFTRDRAVASLEYGGVAVNTPTFVAYGGMSLGAVWGSHPNDKSRQSGYGLMGNMYGLPNPEKTVAYGPPLNNATPFDGANAPPPVVLDCLLTATCAPTTLSSISRLMRVLFVRLLVAIFAPILPKVVQKDLRVKYGNAML